MTTPWPMPARVVKKTTDQAGFIGYSAWTAAIVSVIDRGRYWLAGFVSHSGISG